MEIRYTNTTLVTLVEFEEIPFLKLLLKSTIQALGDLFQFKRIDARKKEGENPVIFCELGEFVFEDDSYVIKRMEIGRRKIIIEVEGDSHIAKEVFKAFRSLLMDMSDIDSSDYLSPVIQSVESAIIAKLDFHAKGLIHPNLRDFIDDAVLDKVSTEYGKATLNYFSQKFRFDYLLYDESLVEKRITLSPKTFSVEPRDGTALEDQVFISEAPVDTDVHIQLLKELESRFSE